MDDAFNNTGIVFLEESDFDKSGLLNVRTDKPLFVAILSTGCPWCHKVVPELLKLSQNKNVDVAVVVADENPLGQTLLQRVGVSGVPTFILFRDRKLQTVYDGPREVSQFVKFALA